MYRVHDGIIGLSLISADGREALVSLLGTDSYFGGRKQAGTLACGAAATSLTPATVLRMDRAAFLDHLAADRGAMETYIAHLAQRNLEYESDLCGHLFDTSERRLLHLLLKLCRLGVMDGPSVEIPLKLTHDMLAQMVGTTRSRITFFMNNFRRRGWVQYGRALIVNIGNIPPVSE